MTSSLSANWRELPTLDKQRLAYALLQRDETKRPPLHERFRWRPQARQAVLLQAAGALDYLLGSGPIGPPVAPIIGYGGAAGGGKTDSLLALGAVVCDAYPGASVVFYRRTYEELEGAEGAIQRSLELFHELGDYNDGKHRWSFANGSRFYFRHMHTLKDMYKYQSQQIGLLLIDEATHFQWEMIDYLITRNRSTSGMVPFAVLASNPGNMGHGWYSGLFDLHDLSGGADGPHETVKLRETPNEKQEKIFFVPARLEDNLLLMEKDPDYERKLTNRSEDLVEALRYGNWQVFAGQSFKVWRRERHVVKPFALPKSWPRWRAVDWGYHKPMSCHWYARDPDSGRIFVYRELYGPGMTDRAQARAIKEMTPDSEGITITYADPSMWERKNREGEVFSTADEYLAEGVTLIAADNDRMSGKRKVDRVLGNLPDGLPGLQVFENCHNLIRTLPMLVYDQTNPEDIDTTQEDHAYDDLRYALTNYRIYGQAQKPAARQISPLAKLGRRRL